MTPVLDEQGDHDGQDGQGQQEGSVGERAPVAWPHRGVDARVALATSIASAPGVYAVLVGSGMSSAAGVPTGWQVVQDLIRQVAAAEGVDAASMGERPEDWWAAQGRPEARYDTLLAALASTDAARQALLRRYFDPPPGAGGPLVPTSAHRALAAMVAAGRVRVLVTTNFDRLLERALDEAGVPPQVVSQPAAAAGMVPLAHAAATLVKLHGDYASLGLRNTPAELATYPLAWRRLLARVLDEYALLVVGWSGDHDVALAGELTRSPSRRYPVFWAAHQGQLSEQGRRLATLRQATVLAVNGADDLFDDLQERLGRLDAAAARRGGLRYRSQLHAPPQRSTPPGWAVMPLLLVRATASLTPASTETVDPIGPEHREQLTAALDRADLGALLREVAAEHFPVAATTTGSTGDPLIQAPLDGWVATPEGFQSTAFATYRLGGDATSGVGALANVASPEASHGGHVQVTVDVAISVAHPLSLVELAAVMRQAVDLAGIGAPEALAELLPPEAAVSRLELHLLAEDTDGRGYNRPNDLEQRVVWDPLGTRTRQFGSAAGTAVQLRGPLSSRDTTALVTGALSRMALDGGALDPRHAIQQIHHALDRPDSP